MRVYLFVFFSQGWSYRPIWSFERGSFERILKVIMPFLSDQKIGGQLGPLPLLFQKSSDQNFETAILFVIVGRPNNYAFGYNTTPTVPGERSLSYKTCPLFAHSACYSEIYIQFRVGGTNFLVAGFSKGEFSMGREFPGGEIFWGNITVREFVIIPI